MMDKAFHIVLITYLYLIIANKYINIHDKCEDFLNKITILIKLTGNCGYFTPLESRVVAAV